MANLIEKAHELKRVRAKHIENMGFILSKDDGETGLSPEDAAQLAEHEKCIKDLDTRVVRLEAFNEMAQQKAVEPSDNEPDDTNEKGDDDDDMENKSAFMPKRSNSGVLIKNYRYGQFQTKKNDPGIQVARFAMAGWIAKKNMSMTAGARFAEDVLKDKMVAKALNSTTAITGGALVPQDFYAELIPLLYAKSTVRKIGPRVIPAPYGNLTIPRLFGGATANWLGNELDSISESQGQTDDIQMYAKKLVALVPATMDLVRRSAISIETMIRDDMVEQLALREDLGFLVGSGNSGVPTGLTNQAGITSLTTSNTFNLENATNALRLMELSLIGANVPMDTAHWIWHPSVRMGLATITDNVGYYVFAEELNKGTLFGHPYAETNQLPTNLGGGSNQTQIMLVAASEIIIADTMALMVDSSQEATYIDNSSNVQSAYQTDRVLFRAIKEVDLAVRHPAAICLNQVQGWSPSGYTGLAGAAYSTQAAVTTPSYAQSTQG
jgi:HK97 family phage major capsid protein